MIDMRIYVIKNKDGLYWGGDRRNPSFVEHVNCAKKYGLCDAYKDAERRDCTVVEVEMIENKYNNLGGYFFKEK